MVILRNYFIFRWNKPNLSILRFHSGFSKVVELLVRNGADVNIENFEKYTILQWAVQKGEKAMFPRF